MKRDDLRRWLADTQASTPARFVFIALTLHANGDLRAWPAVSRLATETGLCDRTVRYALDELEAAGDIEAVERPGQSSMYQIADNPGKRCTPAGNAPLQENPEPLQEIPGTPAAAAPKGIRKELEGARLALPDDPDAIDRARNLAGVDAARAAKRAALHGTRSS